jgi:DNA-binding LacI/PurR family transcriptional regulator
MKTPHRPPVTQKQIADELGVSRQLVSLVLNGTGRISEENRRRVRETAERLGYDANSNLEARAMIARRYSKRAKTGLLGCVSFHPPQETAALLMPLPYEAHLLQGIRHEAQLRGTDVLLLNAQTSSGWERVDGLLTHGGSMQVIRDRLGVAIPTVSMMSEVPGFSSVIVADRDGARLATEYLLGIGHRRIAYLLYTDSTPSVQERQKGYEDALRSHGIRPLKSWIGELINYGDMLERGQRSMELWLKTGWKKLGCTALMVQNDRAAIGAMNVLRNAGIRVPEDVSVIGFDSTDECDIALPRLTSVRVPLEDVGAKAARMLLRQIEGGENGGPGKPVTVTLPTKLVVRDSTAPPRVDL